MKKNHTMSTSSSSESIPPTVAPDPVTPRTRMARRGGVKDARSRFSAALVLLLTLLLITTSAPGAVFLWDGGGTDNNWSTANNWNPNGAPAQPGTGVDDFQFAGGTRTTPNMQASYNLNSITFNSGASAFTIGSGVFTLTLQSGVTNNDNSTQTININTITLGAAQTWSAAAADLTFGGTTLGLGANQTLTIAGANDVIINNQITGTGTSGITMNGTDSVTLTGNNTYTGATTVNAGAFIVSGTGAGINQSTPITINGGTLQLVNSTDGGENKIGNSVAINMNGGTFDFNHVAGNFDYLETVGTLSLNSGASTVDASASNGGAGNSSILTFSSLTRALGATVNFSGSPTAVDDDNNVRFTTPPTLVNGIVGGWATVGNEWATNATTATPSIQAFAAYSDAAEGSWTGTLNLKPTASRTMTASRTLNSLNISGGAKTISGSGFQLTLGTGGLLASGGNHTVSVTSLTAGSAAGAELIATVEVTRNLSISSTITNNPAGSVALVKSGTGTLTLTGTNKYTGGTYHNSGTLDVQRDGGLGSGNVAVANGATLILRSGTTHQYIGSSAQLLLTGTGTVTNGFTGTNIIGSLSFDGVPQVAGTWGSLASTAVNKSTRFTGLGILKVVSSTSTTVATSGTPSTYGDAVTFTATVSGSGGTPTGTVQFKTNGVNAGSPVSLTLGNANSAAISTLPVGNNSVTAEYSGDANFTASTNTLAGGQTVNAKTVTPVIVANDKVYDGTTTATLSSQSVTGTVGADVVTLVVGAADFDTKDAGTGKTVTATTLSLGGASAGNYVLGASTANDTADIAAKTVTPVIVANDKVYDGTTVATLSSQGVTGVVGAEVVTLGVGDANFDNKNIGINKTVTATTLTLGGADAANYVLGAATATDQANIAARPVTPIITANSKTYDGSTTATLSSQGVTGTIGGDVVTLGVGDANFDTKNAGTGKTVTATTLTLGGAGAGNYALSAATATDLANISVKTVTPVIVANNKTYDGNTTATLSSQSVTGTVGADLVTLGVGDANFDTPDVGTGKTVTGTTLSLGGADAGNYVLGAASATSLADITAKSVTPVIVANSKTYDGNATATLSSQSVTGTVGADDVTLGVGAANFDTKDVGTGKTVTATTLSLGGADAGNYVLGAATATDLAIITAKTVTPVIVADNKIYDGNTTATLSSQTVTGTIGADVVTLGVGIANFDTKNIGINKTVTATALSLGGADGGNYVLGAATAIDLANITAKTVTPVIVANGKTYDGNATATLSSQGVTGVVGVEVVTLGVGAANFDTPEAGTGKTVTATGLTLGGVDAGNYVLGAATATDLANIAAKAVTPVIVAEDKVYDATTTATLSSQSVTGTIGADVVTLGVGAANFDNRNIGIGKTVTATALSLGGADAGNYALSSPTAIDVADITAKTVTPVIAANDKVYNGNTTATLSSATVTGIAGTDVVTLGVGAANFNTKDVGTGKTVTGTGLTLGGADAGNYVLGAASATALADITAKTVTPVVVANDKTYDGNTTATLSSQSVTGTIGAEVVTLGVGDASFDTKNVGTNKTVTATTLSLGGADAGNYALATATATDLADITARAVTPVITANSKVYDGSTVATLSSQGVTGTVGADVVTLGVGAANFDTKDVGLGKTVTATGLTLGGANASDYALASATTTDLANITAKTVLPVIAANNKVYDGNTAATLSSQGVTGTIGLDVVTLGVGDANFDTKNVGIGKTVTGTGLSLGGAGAGNYVLGAVSATTLANITAKSVTPVIVANNKTYDGSTTATLSSQGVTGTIGLDEVTLGVGAANFDTKTAGTGKTVTASTLTLGGADGGNYVLDSATATDLANILPKSVTPLIVADDKTYDGNRTASLSSYTVTGTVGADVVTLGVGTALFDTKNVGVNKTVTGAALSLGGADAINYVLDSATATDLANITAKPVTPVIVANNKLYDGTTTATLNSQFVTGTVGVDVVTLGVGAANFDTPAAGTGKTVTGTTLTLGGADAGNYALDSATATDLANIASKAVTPVIVANNKTYDGNTTATLSSRSVTGTIGADVVTLGVGDANFDTKNVGVNKTVTGTSLSLGGADAGNYVLDSATVTDQADITTKTVMPVILANNKVYDGNTTATLLGQGVTGTVGADVVDLGVGAANFNNKNVGTGKTVTASTLTLSGADAGNYVLGAATATDLANITVKTVTPVIVANNKPYDGTTAATLGSQSVTGTAGADVVTLGVGDASFDTKNIGTDKTVTASPLSLGGADAGNYVLSAASATDLADITQRPVTPVITANSKLYDGNTTATLSSQGVTGTVGAEVATLGVGAANFDTKDVGTGKTVTATGLTLGGADAGNYVLGSATATDLANIAAKAVLPVIAANNKTYDGSTTATLSSQTVTGTIGADIVTLGVGDANFDTKNVGINKTVTATNLSLGGPAGNNYVLGASSATNQANITAKSVTPEIVASDKTYDGNTTATLSSQGVTGTVGLDVVTLGVGAANFDTKDTGTGKTVTATTLALGGADAGNYSLDSATATDLADIAPKPVTPVIAADDKTYDGNRTATLSSGTVTGTIGADIVTLGVGAALFDTRNIGLNKTVTATTLSLGGADAGNYVLDSATATDLADITAKSVTPVIVANNKLYDGTTTATLNSQFVTGVVGADVVTLGVGAVNFDTPDVGTGKTVTGTLLTLGGVGASNYVLDSATATDLANIAAKALTPVIVANNKVYDGITEATLSSQSVTGTIGADVVTLGVGAANFDTKNVGTGKTVTGITLSLGGADAGNYVLDSVTATALADITAKTVTPVIAANDKLYDGNTTATLSSQGVTGTVGGDVVTLGVGAANFDTRNVGTGKTVTGTTLTLGGADVGNYVLGAASASALADITARTVTPVIVANDKTYDGITEATLSSQSVTGTIGADVVTLGVGAANFDNKNVGSSKTVTGTTLSLGGADAGNYVLGAATATDLADITTKPLTPVIVANNKVYDGTTAATLNSQFVTGTVGAEVVTLGVGTVSFDTKNVGAGKTVTATGLTLGGADASNYVLGSATATDLANITARTAMPVIVANNKLYDGHTLATLRSRSVTGTIGGDVVLLGVGAANFDNKNVGTGKTVTATSLFLGGPDGANYVLGAASATSLANITPKTVLPVIVANDKTYDGTTTATLSSQGVTGAISGDLVTLGVGGASFNNKNVGFAKTVTASSLSLGGADAGNYLLGAATAIDLANITTRTVTPVIVANDKMYDGTTTATLSSQSVTGTLGADVVTLTAGAANFDTKNVGINKLVTATALSLGGADAGNYTLGAASATDLADITTRPVTPVIVANDKVFDGTTTATLSSQGVIGALGADVVTLTVGAANFDTPDIGTGKTVTATTLSLGGADAGNYSLDSASATGLADIVATAPVILSITGAGTTNVVITWSSVSNTVYRLQFRPDFNSGWVDLVPDITATGDTTSAVDDPGGDMQRFYRVQVP